MKEITRIHLAKVAYDIEIDAKKDIQKYIAALERYAGDAEIVEDIEIRMTELLAERGVAAGGVIAKDDVAAVRAQLGEPSDFASEGDIAVGHDIGDAPKRRLFRDTDNAMAEGVLAGIGQFFGINAVWVRLIFIVLLFASFGAAIIVYIILCIVVPPAKTAAEKLQMRGEPVTLEAIKALGEQEPKEGNASMATTRQVLRITAGVVTLLGAIGALCVTLFIGFGLTFGTSDYSPIAHFRPQESWWVALALGLFVLAGLLLAALGFVLTNSLFRKQWNKRIGTAVVAIITAGLLSFVGGVGTVLYGSWQYDMYMRDSQTVSTVNLPADFVHVKKLVVDTSAVNIGWGDIADIHVEYRVSDTPRYEVRSLAGTPEVAMSEDSTQATVTWRIDEKDARYRYGQPSIVMYGPALDEIEEKTGSVSYYNEAQQAMIRLISRKSSVELRGSYDTVEATAHDTGAVRLRDASIRTLTATTRGGYVTAGVVRDLAATHPEVCPANESEGSLYDVSNRIVVTGITGVFTYNGEAKPHHTHEALCGVVIIGDEGGYTERKEAMLDD